MATNSTLTYSQRRLFDGKLYVRLLLGFVLFCSIMRGLKTISYFSHDIDVARKRDALSPEQNNAFSDKHLRYLRAFQRHLSNKNWDKAIRYLKRLSKTSLFLTAVARGGFLITNASQLRRREIINRVIKQLNERNKIDWLRGLSYHSYVNQISNELYVQFRCDSVSAYYIIKNNKIRINRGWVQGWTPEHAARQMQR